SITDSISARNAKRVAPLPKVTGLKPKNVRWGRYGLQQGAPEKSWRGSNEPLLQRRYRARRTARHRAAPLPRPEPSVRNRVILTDASGRRPARRRPPNHV